MKIDSNRKIYSVSEVNYFARQTLEQMEVWVEGEISTFKQNPNWRFYYLDLKDDTALLPCICDGSVFNGFVTEELVGQKILAHGFLTLYEPRGQYQLKILKIEAVGIGVLQKRLEELIKKLKGEGLFDTQYKKEIPAYPKKICVVTSLGSDAWNDFKRHTADKFPIIELSTADVRVQGSQSIPQLLKVLPKADIGGFDVIIITRGGGSLEDLAAFNDEEVARTIFKMKTPTIVAIGHEANESLAEWVADRRASTPTDAATIVTLGYTQVLEKLETLKLRLSTRSDRFFSENFQKLDMSFKQLIAMKSYFKDLPHRLNTLSESLKRHEKLRVADALDRANTAKKQIIKASRLFIQSHNLKLANLAKALTLLSPKNTLKRGYAIATGKSGKIIRSISAVVVGTPVAVKLTDGSFKSRVTSKRN